MNKEKNTSKKEEKVFHFWSNSSRKQHHVKMCDIRSGGTEQVYKTRFVSNNNNYWTNNSIFITGERHSVLYIVIFCTATPFSLVGGCQSLGITCCLHLQCMWRQHVPFKRWQPLTTLYCVTKQNTTISPLTAVKTLNLGPS
jgi:hypothetical protein